MKHLVTHLSGFFSSRSGAVITPSYWLLENVAGGVMDILKALRAEEAKFLQQISDGKQQLETVRVAIRLVSDEAKSKSVGGETDSPSSKVQSLN